MYMLESGCCPSDDGKLAAVAVQGTKGLGVTIAIPAVAQQKACPPGSNNTSSDQSIIDITLA